MKISLNCKEVLALNNIMESVEKDSVKELSESLKRNNLIKVSLDIPTSTLNVDIDEEYSVEFLEVYGKYLDVLISQAKTMYKTMVLLTEETEKVVVKHMAKNAKNAEEKTEETSEDTKEE